MREDWPRYHEYARTRGSIYGGVTGVKRGDESAEEWDGERYARGESPAPYSEYNEKYDKEAAQGRFDDNMHAGAGGGLAAEREEARYAMRTPSPNGAHQRGSSNYPLSPTLKALYPHDAEHQTSPSAGRRTSTQAPTQPFIPRDSAISRTDLIASAERIYSRYLMPGADKEVYLPPALRIHEFPLSSSTLPVMSHPDYDREADAQARVPDMFHAQKEYVYRAMELDTFPRFLRAKAFGNLTPVSALVRLGVGLLALWIALATAFSFIFLDYKPKIKRLWVSDSASPVGLGAGLATDADSDPRARFAAHPPVHGGYLEPGGPLLRPRPSPRLHGPLRDGEPMSDSGSSRCPLTLYLRLTSLARVCPPADPLPHHRHPRALRSQATLRPSPLGHLPDRHHRRRLDCHLHRHPRTSLVGWGSHGRLDWRSAIIPFPLRPRPLHLRDLQPSAQTTPHTLF